jgi:hypothetical protein
MVPKRNRASLVRWGRPVDLAKARAQLAELISKAQATKYADEQTKSEAFGRFVAALIVRQGPLERRWW